MMWLSSYDASLQIEPVRHGGSVLQGRKIINRVCCEYRILLCMVSQPWHCRSVCVKSLILLIIHCISSKPFLSHCSTLPVELLLLLCISQFVSYNNKKSHKNNWNYRIHWMIMQLNSSFKTNEHVGQLKTTFDQI